MAIKPGTILFMIFSAFFVAAGIGSLMVRRKLIQRERKVNDNGNTDGNHHHNNNNCPKPCTDRERAAHSGWKDLLDFGNESPNNKHNGGEQQFELQPDPRELVSHASTVFDNPHSKSADLIDEADIMAIPPISVQALNRQAAELGTQVWRYNRYFPACIDRFRPRLLLYLPDGVRRH